MLHLIFWAFVFILGLSYFGISIQGILNSPVGQENIAYLAQLFSQIWHSLAPYIQPIIDFVQRLPK